MESRNRAIIEIGSTGVRLVVARFEEGGSYRTLDAAERETHLGRDVFADGVISRESINECVSILRGFQELLRSYALEPGDARVVATSALREASNRDTFIDRVAMRTGLKVEIIEDVEENHYLYLAVQRALADDARNLSRYNSIIIEVGGGSTEIMLLRRGKIMAAHSLGLGTVRVGELVKAAVGAQGYLMRFLADNIRTTCDMLEEDLSLASVREFVAIGGDARFCAGIAGRPGGANHRIVPREDYLEFTDRLRLMTPYDIVAKYGLGYTEAEGAVVSLLIMRLILERTQAAELIVPSVSIRDGLLLSAAHGAADGIATEMHRQVVASVINLGKKYHFDESHAVQVARLATGLFDGLKDLHGYGDHERLLVESAALLHDVGTFVRPSGHHRHSEYLIQNSEIFGLQRSDLVITANIARYHRKAGPSPAHANYMSLSREERMIVLKLAAILRLADALDRGHTQKIEIAALERKEDHLVIVTGDSGDLSLERASLSEKGDMFEDVYGFRVVIR